MGSGGQGASGASGGGSGASSVGGATGTAGSVGASGMGGGAGGGGIAGSGPGVVPPKDPNGPAPTGAPLALAIKRIYWGDKNRDGSEDPQAWKDFGFNLDGLVSTPTSTDHCTPAAGADTSLVFQDGNNGIDNAYGARLFPSFLTLAPFGSSELDQEYLEGRGQPFIYLDSVTLNDGSAPDQSGVVARLYHTDTRPATPKWGGSDTWRIASHSLTDLQDNDSSRYVFSSGYVVGGVWVSGPGQFDLYWPLADTDYFFPFSHAVIIADLSQVPNTVTGIIAGVIDTELWLENVRRSFGALDPSLCSTGAIESIIGHYVGFSDIMKDGGNGDPSQTCDGISVGLPFEAVVANRGSVKIVEPAEDPCE